MRGKGEGGYEVREGMVNMSRESEVGAGERFEVTALYSCSEDIHQVGGWSDTEE